MQRAAVLAPPAPTFQSQPKLGSLSVTHLAAPAPSQSRFCTFHHNIGGPSLRARARMIARAGAGFRQIISAVCHHEH